VLMLDEISSDVFDFSTDRHGFFLGFSFLGLLGSVQWQ